MKIIRYIKSLFVKYAVPIDHSSAWYYVKGKKKSALEIFIEYNTEIKTSIKKRIEEGPNIHIEI